MTTEASSEASVATSSEASVAKRTSTDTITDAVLEHVVVHGDLSKLSASDRLVYYRRVCESLGLNPLTKPFQYIILNGKLTLYATRDATDQLRKRDNISIEIVGAPQLVNNVYIVTARATTAGGRTDTEIGAVTVENLKGDTLANAMMKAMTKVKRRVTLSIVGLGLLDETEIETIPDAQHVHVDAETGEITTEKASAAQVAVIKNLAEVWDKTKLKALLTQSFPAALTEHGWQPGNLSTVEAQQLITALGDEES